MTTAHGSPEPTLRTPYLLLDPAEAVQDLTELQRALPDVGMRYQVAANAHPRLLHALAGAGAGFAVSGPEQAVACLAAGAPASALLHDRPVTRRDDLAVEAALGVDLFTVDSPAEAWKLAESAPGAQVLCRLRGPGSGGPHGCTPGEAVATLRLAAALGLRPVGVGVAAGTGRPDPRAWRGPVHQAARVFARLAEEGLDLELLDLGGGFPAWLAGAHLPSAYGREITRAVALAFGRTRPRLVARPGRGVAADAGTLVTSVVGVTWYDEIRRVTVDASSAALVAAGSAPRVDAPSRGRKGPCLLLAASGAPALRVDLPLGLAEGDPVLLRCAGAYGDPRVPAEPVEPLVGPGLRRIST